MIKRVRSNLTAFILSYRISKLGKIVQVSLLAEKQSRKITREFQCLAATRKQWVGRVT